MPLYSAGNVMLESGVFLNGSSMQKVNRVTNVKVDYSVPRANLSNMGRGKPLNNRPVVNYTPINVSLNMFKSDNSLEQMLGLINPTGVAMLITSANPLTATYGIRSMQVYYAPNSSSNYNSLLDIKSGVLTQYSLQGNITDAMTQTVSLQFLDMSGSVNNTARDTSIYATNPIKPENISLTGIQFSGYGISGLTIQSFALNIGFTRVSTMYMGSALPIDRPLSDVNATLQIQGFLEGTNNSLTSLSQYSVGSPTYETISLVLTPSCGQGSPSTITITNPYLENMSIESQVGNFSTVSFSFSMPLGPNPSETGDGSTLALT